MTDIKIWSKTLLTTYTILPQLVESLDECNMAAAMRAFRSDTMKAIQEIQNNIHRKQNLINLKVVIDKCMKEVKTNHKDVLCLRFFKRKNFQCISDTLNICLRTAFRRYANALIEMESILEKLGYDSKWLEKNYLDDKLVGNIYRKIKEDNEKTENTQRQNAEIVQKKAQIQATNIINHYQKAMSINDYRKVVVAK